MTTSPEALRRLNRTRWIIYLLVGLAVLVPMVIPKMSLPLTPNPEAKKLYNQVDALESGSHVLLSFDYDPASRPELNPMGKALLRHCFKKGLIPIVMTHWPPGIGQAEQVVRETAADSAKRFGRELKSGRDYVFLGFKPGGSSLILNMGENLKGAFAKDYYGKPTASMSALKDVNSLKDIQMAVDLAAGADVQGWIVYGSDRLGFPLGAGTTAVQMPDMYPYLNSGQLVGMLGGLRGAADYETLLGIPEDGIRGMVSQSVAHLLMIALIIFANVRMFAGRFSRTAKE